MVNDWKIAAAWLTARSPNSSSKVASAPSGIGVEHVEVATLEVGVGRFLRGVEDDVEAAVLRPCGRRS